MYSKRRKARRIKKHAYMVHGYMVAPQGAIAHVRQSSCGFYARHCLIHFFSSLQPWRIEYENNANLDGATMVEGLDQPREGKSTLIKM
jgi:hypothetical protein